MKIPYPRPLQLSDPFWDFGGADSASEILFVSDDQMGWGELACIFDTLPAGIYEECVYFVPLAIKFIQEEEDGWELLERLLIWVGRNKRQLREDNLYGQIVANIKELFFKWTGSFSLEMAGHGGYYPSHSSAVTWLLSVLNSEPGFSQLGDVWLEELFSEITDYRKAAWLLHLLREYETGEISAKSPALNTLYFDTDKNTTAYDLILQECCADPCALAYWNDQM
jgi:hypothetical protein